MIVETRKLYRATDTRSGLEILIFAITFDPGARPCVLATDIDGQVVWIDYELVKLNWRWNQKTRDWDDIDLPIEASGGE